MASMSTEVVVKEDGRHNQRSYTPEEKLEALRVMARHGGSLAKAAEETGISPNTIRSWRYRDKELRAEYQRLAAEMWEHLRLEGRERHFEAAAHALDIELKIKERLEENIDKLDPRDLSTAYRNASVVAGVHTDKAVDLAGDNRPIQINMNMDEVIKSLVAKGAKVIEGTAEEVPESTPSAPGAAPVGNGLNRTEESSDAEG